MGSSIEGWRSTTWDRSRCWRWLWLCAALTIWRGNYMGLLAFFLSLRRNSQEEVDSVRSSYLDKASNWFCAYQRWWIWQKLAKLKTTMSPGSMGMWPVRIETNCTGTGVRSSGSLDFLPQGNLPLLIGWRKNHTTEGIEEGYARSFQQMILLKYIELLLIRTLLQERECKLL